MGRRLQMKTPKKKIKNNIMKYLKYRSRMQNGDVIAFQGSDAGAKLICRSTKSIYSHVGLVVRIKDVSINRVFIAESVVPSGVSLVSLRRKIENYPGRAWWFSLNIGGDAKRKRKFIYKWAMSELGKRYDFELIKYIAKNVLFKSAIPEATKEQYICSEYVATAFDEAHLLPKDISLNLTPEQIAKLPILGEFKEII